MRVNNEKRLDVLLSALTTDTKLMDVLGADSKPLVYDPWKNKRGKDEPNFIVFQKAIWWLRVRQGLSKSDAWLVARHSGFSAFSRMFWLPTRYSVRDNFKRAWRYAGRDPLAWKDGRGWETGSVKVYGEVYFNGVLNVGTETWRRSKPAKTRRDADTRLWSARSDWLAVWQFVQANPGLSHREMRRSGLLSGHYRHLRIQAALEYLEAAELLDVERAGKGLKNAYYTARVPVVQADPTPGELLNAHPALPYRLPSSKRDRMAELLTFLSRLNAPPGACSDQVMGAAA